MGITKWNKKTMQLEKITDSLSKAELSILKKLSSPIKIQDFLDTLPFNLEKEEETYHSPRMLLKRRTAHCMEGALLAALALWIHGDEPLVLDLDAPDEINHMVALYKRNGYWGAISKTNHSCLRFRDPVYKTIRELVLSYFHEYFDSRPDKRLGNKLLRSYVGPINLKKFKHLDKEGQTWVTSQDNLGWIPEMLDKLKHYELVPKANKNFLRKADKMERKAGEIVEWK